MQFSDKQLFIQKFFEEFERKIARLQELYAKSYKDEAFTLCLVYIDRLASGHYGGEQENHKNFCRALKELSGNPLFGMIHPRKLLELTKAKCSSAASLMESIVNRQPQALLKEDELAQEIRNSSLTDGEKDGVISNLWRASMASSCYAYIRNPEVHGPGSGGLDFDETIYEGKKGVSLDFEVLYDALDKIFRRIWAISIEGSQWFGNPDYIKRLYGRL